MISLRNQLKKNLTLLPLFLIKKFEFFIPLEEGFDKDKEINKLKKELDYYRSFLKSVEIKLKNENFMKNAPKNIIEKEKQKLKIQNKKLSL